MLSRWFFASRRLAGASTKYILAVESEHGFEPANFLDASARETLENRPGIFAKMNFNNQACLAKISSVRPVVHKNLSGNIMVANQISQIQKSINSGLIQTVIDEKNVKIPYKELSEEISNLPIAAFSELVLTFDVVKMSDGQLRAINIRQSLEIEKPQKNQSKKRARNNPRKNRNNKKL